MQWRIRRPYLNRYSTKKSVLSRTRLVAPGRRRSRRTAPGPMVASAPPNSRYNRRRRATRLHAPVRGTHTPPKDWIHVTTRPPRCAPGVQDSYRRVTHNHRHASVLVYKPYTKTLSTTFPGVQASHHKHHRTKTWCAGFTPYLPPHQDLVYRLHTRKPPHHPLVCRITPGKCLHRNPPCAGATRWSSSSTYTSGRVSPDSGGLQHWRPLHPNAATTTTAGTPQHHAIPCSHLPSTPYTTALLPVHSSTSKDLAGDPAAPPRPPFPLAPQSKPHANPITTSAYLQQLHPCTLSLEHQQPGPDRIGHLHPEPIRLFETEPPESLPQPQPGTKKKNKKKKRTTRLTPGPNRNRNRSTQ